MSITLDRTHTPTPGGESMPISGVLAIQATDVTTSGTTIETVFSDVLFANMLSKDGDMVKFRVLFDTEANANSKTMTLLIGGQSLQSVTATYNDFRVVFDVDLIRTGVGTQLAIKNGQASNANFAAAFGDLTRDETTDLPIEVKITTPTQAGDATLKAIIIEYIPAP
jgi:hypothetical protein